MDRKIYKLPFSEEQIPKWICPSCGKGILAQHNKSFKSFETVESKKNHSHSAFEFYWIRYTYSCLLKCTSCDEIVSNIGDGFVDTDVDIDETGNYIETFKSFFRAKYFNPHLKIFKVPANVSDNIRHNIFQSFDLFFCNPASSSNHIRIALENLLTHLKIKRFETRNGKRIFLSLHKRIDLIPSKYSKYKTWFLAVKWLGNAGSHSDMKITIDDVLDAYEIMEELLNIIFVDDKKRIEKIAKKINKKQGPAN